MSFSSFSQVGEGAAHEPLDAEDGVLGVGQGAVAGGGADEDGAVVVEADALGTRAAPAASRTTTGRPSSMYAARLNVVPRSMPTTAGGVTLIQP